MRRSFFPVAVAMSSAAVIMTACVLVGDVNLSDKDNGTGHTVYVGQTIAVNLGNVPGYGTVTISSTTGTIKQTVATFTDRDGVHAEFQLMGVDLGGHLGSDEITAVVNPAPGSLAPSYEFWKVYINETYAPGTGGGGGGGLAP